MILPQPWVHVSHAVAEPAEESQATVGLGARWAMTQACQGSRVRLGLPEGWAVGGPDTHLGGEEPTLAFLPLLLKHVLG